MLGRAAIYRYIWRNQQRGGLLYRSLRQASKLYRRMSYSAEALIFTENG
ncbi:MAG: hypothetical protein LH606_01100 [Cytophagaceae bacterium]|nr:hypothetical protein [Cytophagaceae bacterium]